MKITPVPHHLELVRPSVGRSTGLHISDIYNDMFSDLEPSRYDRASAPNTVKMAMGLAWETYLEGVLVASGVQAKRPGEFITDEGIAFSPDLLIENGSDRVGEIKLTYMSAAESLDDPKFKKWLVQAMAYCHHLQIPRCRFYVLFVNGNYRDKRDPEFKAFDIEFSARNLRENWDMLLNHARHKGLI